MAGRHILGDMMRDRLTGHVRRHLAIELDKSRIHEWKSLGMRLVLLNLDVETGNLATAVPDSVNLLADEGECGHPFEAKDREAHGLAVGLLNVLLPQRLGALGVLVVIVFLVVGYGIRLWE